jgi:hypothetical protein
MVPYERIGLKNYYPPLHEGSQIDLHPSFLKRKIKQLRNINSEYVRSKGLVITSTCYDPIWDNWSQKWLSTPTWGFSDRSPPIFSKAEVKQIRNLNRKYIRTKGIVLIVLFMVPYVRIGLKNDYPPLHEGSQIDLHPSFLKRKVKLLQNINSEYIRTKG